MIENPSIDESEHLQAGGVYSVLAQEDGRGDYLLAKVLEAGAVVHVVLLAHSFKRRPQLDDIKNLSMSLDEDLAEARNRHLALSRKLFSLMRPVLLQKTELSQADQAGLRKWKMLDQKEIIEAPDLIESEANTGVWWRIFLMTGLPFGLLQALFNYFRYGLAGAFFGFVLGALCFGGAMVGLQYFSVARRLKLGFSRLPAGTLSAFQVQEIVLPGSYEGVFGAALKSLASIKNLKLEIEDYSGGTIEARVKSGLLEGEKISINAYKVDSSYTGVVVTSVPGAGGEIDLGRNFAHVVRIVDYLKQSCSG